VIHACKKVVEKVAAEPGMRELIERLESRLKR
jgi:hypothetical protein